MSYTVDQHSAELSTFNEKEHKVYLTYVTYFFWFFIIVCVIIFCGKAVFGDLGKLMSGLFGVGNTLCSEIDKLFKSCDDGFFETKCVFMWILMIPGGLLLIYGAVKLYTMSQSSKDNKIDTESVELLTGKTVPELINDVRDTYKINTIEDLKDLMKKSGVSVETLNPTSIELFFSGLCTKHFEAIAKDALSKQVLSPENIKKQIDELNKEAKQNEERANEDAKDLTEEQRKEVNDAVERVPNV
jgi:hypothetical protein